MSYEVVYLDDQLYIPKENFEACLAEIIEFHKEVQPNIQCPGGALAHTAKSLEQKVMYALAHFGWPAQIDEYGVSGLIEGLTKRGGEDIIKRIARYVEKDSCIEYIGDDGVAVKYEFDGTKVHCYQGEIAYSEKN